MKCPHCEYQHGEIGVEALESDFVTGAHGEFFQLPVKLTRNEKTYYRETKALYGCPACNKTFIGE